MAHQEVHNEEDQSTLPLVWPEEKALEISSIEINYF